MDAGALSTVDSFAATQIVFMVIAGASASMISGGAVWAAVRGTRAAIVFLRSRVLPPLGLRWLSHRTRHLALRESLRTAASDLGGATRVRLSGVVEADRLAMAGFSGQPTVISRHEVGERGGGSVDRGLAVVDFHLRLADGSKVRVLAEDAHSRRALRIYDQRPHRWRAERDDRGWFCESRLAPGDSVEVIGQVQRELDTHAERVSDRQAPLTWTLRADQRLCVRFRTRTAG